MEKQKLISERRGTAIGLFEVRFQVKFGPGIQLTRKFCNNFNDKMAKSIISGRRRDSDMKKLFEEHFHVKLPEALQGDSFNLVEQWVGYEQETRDLLPENGGHQ